MKRKTNLGFFQSIISFLPSQSKIENFLETLAGLKRPYPVGNTSVAAKQFRVTEKEFEKKIALYANDKNSETLYLGTSSTFKKVHARRDDEKPVYEIEFETYEASTNSSSWWDKDYLHIARDDIAQIQFPDFSLVQSSDNVFEVESLEEGNKTNTEKVNSLLGKITSLTFSKVLGTEDKPEYKDYSEIIAFSLELKSGEVSEYRVLAKDEQASDLILKVSDRPYFFQVSKYSIDDLKNAKRADLVLAKEENKDKTATELEDSGANDENEKDKDKAETPISAEALPDKS